MIDNYYFDLGIQPIPVFDIMRSFGFKDSLIKNLNARIIIKYVRLYYETLARNKYNLTDHDIINLL